MKQIKAYFVIVTKDETERILKEDVVRKLKELDMEVTAPLDYNFSKTVIIKRLDPIIDEYDAEEIKQSIERANNNIEVEEVFVFPTTSKIMKVRLGTSAMAQKVLLNGLLVLNQRVKPNQVEKEIFVKITPCTNCYKYDHVTSRCPQEKMILCAFCGGEDHKQKDCKKETPMCLNCGEQHRTLAAACSVRKELIKEKRISIRDRSRSRSQQRQATAQAQPSSSTYAGKTSQKVPSFFQGLDKEEMKRMVTVIMSAICYSHYMEAQYEGTFQKNMDIIFKKNNLHSVKFPDLIRTEGIKDIFENIEAETVSTEELSREDPSVRRKEKESEKV